MHPHEGNGSPENRRLQIAVADDKQANERDGDEAKHQVVD